VVNAAAASQEDLQKIGSCSVAGIAIAIALISSFFSALPPNPPPRAPKSDSDLAPTEIKIREGGASKLAPLFLPIVCFNLRIVLKM
jgi:hypothetical protein